MAKCLSKCIKKSENNERQKMCVPILPNFFRPLSAVDIMYWLNTGKSTRKLVEKLLAVQRQYLRAQKKTIYFVGGGGKYFNIQ